MASPQTASRDRPRESVTPWSENCAIRNPEIVIAPSSDAIMAVENPTFMIALPAAASDAIISRMPLFVGIAMIIRPVPRFSI